MTDGAVSDFLYPIDGAISDYCPTKLFLRFDFELAAILDGNRSLCLTAL